MVLNLAHDLHTTRSPMQRVPDFQQHTLPVAAPLAIPETQFLNVQCGQKLFPNVVTLPLLRQPMLKTIQFHRQPCRRTVKVEIVFSRRMLTTEFEAGKSSRPQCAPKFFLPVRLLTAKTAGVGRGIHGRKDRKTAVAGKPLSLPLSPLLRRGERECSRGCTAESEKAALHNAVTATDRQIDALVYELYGLTAEEIKLVEGGQ
jgi:hypothetical protein